MTLGGVIAPARRLRCRRRGLTIAGLQSRRSLRQAECSVGCTTEAFGGVFALTAHLPNAGRKAERLVRVETALMLDRRGIAIDDEVRAQRSSTCFCSAVSATSISLTRPSFRGDAWRRSARRHAG